MTTKEFYSKTIKVCIHLSAQQSVNTTTQINNKFKGSLQVIITLYFCCKIIQYWYKTTTNFLRISKQVVSEIQGSLSAQI